MLGEEGGGFMRFGRIGYFSRMEIMYVRKP
jgi:hypothetical protein